MKTWLVPSFILAFVSMGAVADDALLGDLLPRPQKVQILPGQCLLNTDEMHIMLTAPGDEQIKRLTDRLIESLIRLDLNITPAAASGETYLLYVSFFGTPAPFAPTTVLPAAARDQGYALTVTPSSVLIGAASEKGLFYGLMTLEQLLRSAQLRERTALPCMRILDWPALTMRGYSEDYGRDQLPTMDEHKRAIRLLARFKIDTYLWFIEPDHFVYGFDPELGQEYDRFRFEEIRELVAYAREYYIDVIPTVELLGHMEMTLREPRYRHLAEMPEGGGDLCATSDEAFDLVRNMVTEIAPAFDGQYFHCGLDESYAIGKGRSADAVREKGLERVFADYYTKMNELVKSQGKTMMMYADIILNHPGILDLLPGDIVPMFWDYAPRDVYPGLTTLKESGMTFTALSGLWDWNNLYPIYPPAFQNMETLAAQAANEGALGHFVSSWGDGYKGAAGTNLSELNFYGVAYCGAVSWKPEPIALSEYSSAFITQFYGVRDEDFASALTRMARCQGEDLSHTCQARFMFHCDPAEAVWSMAGANEETLLFWNTLGTETRAVHEVLGAVQAAENADYVRSIDLAARMLNTSAEMALAFHRIGAAMEQAEYDREEAAAALESLARTHGALWDEYEAVGRATNRPINLNHIGRVWSGTTEGLSALAAEVRDGRFPAPVLPGPQVAFNFDGAGQDAWRDALGTGLELDPAAGDPPVSLESGGPGGSGGYLSLQHGARCEVVDSNRILD
ncbi:MAG TPA: glycoside hydrolase family 20 zincin-like fold domain-containing protein, partial [Candidatus Hydrogenedentes bacterium]|nr:glycoside hydrolase family 20 zincin-like fold domain-containing protein [Candidatus Hydrogenedentota bacterium]